MSKAATRQEGRGFQNRQESYYAAFCHARDYARDRHGLVPRYTGDDHSLVKRHFQSRRERGVAIKLEDLRIWRSLCDYEDSIQDLPTSSQNPSRKPKK